MKKYVLVLLLSLAMVAAVPALADPAPAVAAAKTDFSGTWKLNVDKSDFGQMPPPVSETDVITQTPTDITVAIKSVREEGERSYTLRSKLDGTETPTPAGTFPADSPFKITSCKAEWDGTDLVVNQKTTFQDNEGTVKSKYTLSADGKVLNKTTQISMPMGDFTIKTVYDKQ